MNPPIVLMTDFGTRDIYVGIMKGVILTIAKNALIIDLTHEISPGNIFEASFKLQQAVKYFPKNTIFVVVVDPGVGTSRRPILASWNHQKFVLPDNGLLTYLLHQNKSIKAWELTNTDYFLPVMSNTFHGRDIFAPVASHLWNGAAEDALGKPLDTHQLTTLKIIDVLQIDQRTFEGVVVYDDRFGNLMTNLGPWEKLAGGIYSASFGVQRTNLTLLSSSIIQIAGENLKLSSTFGDIPAGKLGAIVGSSGYIEVVVNQGSAARLLDLPIYSTLKLLV